MVWALLRGKGMLGPFASVCYMGQVEGVHSADDGRGMSLVQGGISTVATGQWL